MSAQTFLQSLRVVGEMYLIASVASAGYGDNKLHLLVSKDFVQWTDTSDGAGNYTPASGIFRDPTIIYRPSDGMFFVAYTCEAPGPHFGLVSSPDGVTWTHVADIDVNVTGLTTGSHRFTFGPMLYIDPDTEEIWCHLNAFDDRVDNGLGQTVTCYVAKATNAALTQWSGTGVGVAPWTLVTVNNLPVGITSHDLEVTFKVGSTYYALVITTATQDNLGTAYVITASSPFGPWTAVNNTNNLAAPFTTSGFESLWLWQNPAGVYWEIASVAGTTPVNGHLGYHMRNLGTDITNLDTSGAWIPFSMDVVCSQGNRVTHSKFSL